MEYTVFALCVPGAAIDVAVANHLLEALTESNLDISLAVRERTRAKCPGKRAPVANPTRASPL